MKKFIVIVFVLLCMYLIIHDEYNISEDTIRFRVIANSNSSRDILMKEKVVDELSSLLFKDLASEKEVEDNIYNNLKNIENRIDILFKNNNYNKNYNISYGINEFPTKYFLGKKYDKGLYKSLVIEIGDGRGNNYFCILYPSLCMIDYKDNKEEDSKYKFKIIELIEKLF